eukprot:337318_1
MDRCATEKMFDEVQAYLDYALMEEEKKKQQSQQQKPKTTEEMKDAIMQSRPPTFFSVRWWWFSSICLVFSTIMICILSIQMKLTLLQQVSVLALYVLSIVFAVISRLTVQKNKTSILLSGVNDNKFNSITKDIDTVKSISIYSLILAVICYVAGSIIFQLHAIHHYSSLPESGFISAQTLLQLIRWISIQLYSLNRILRPANRCDPLRTIFDLDVVEICLDSIDSSSLFQILITPELSTITYINFLTKIAITMWMTSVGLRIALLFLVHLPASSFIWLIMLPHKAYYMFMPFWFASSTYNVNCDDKAGYVSRVQLALRFRVIQHLLTIPCEIMAIIVRLLIFVDISTQYEQAELLVKNIAGLWRAFRVFYVAYKQKQFDARSALQHLQEPADEQKTEAIAEQKQIQIDPDAGIKTKQSDTELDLILQDENPIQAEKTQRYCGYYLCCKCISMQQYVFLWTITFMISYITICAVLNYYIVLAWNSYIGYLFSVLDILVVYKFWRHVKKGEYDSLSIDVSGPMPIIRMMILLEINMGSYRVPIYYHKYKTFASNDGINSFDSILYVLMLFIIPYYAFHKAIQCNFLKDHYWWTSKKIEDSTYSLTSQAACSEGVLDVLSCSAFLSMAVDNNLNTYMQRTCAAFSILELLNGGLCYATSATICHEQFINPEKMIALVSASRKTRLLIDTGAFIVRMIAWLKFGVIGSVFMIKNLYHIIHAIAFSQRAKGMNYVQTPFFFCTVSSEDWNSIRYGLHQMSIPEEKVKMQARKRLQECTHTLQECKWRYNIFCVKCFEEISPKTTTYCCIQCNCSVCGECHVGMQK